MAEISGNVTILAVGNIVHEYILKTNGKENEILNFGVEDLRTQIPNASISVVPPDKVTFCYPTFLFDH